MDNKKSTVFTQGKQNNIDIENIRGIHNHQ